MAQSSTAGPLVALTLLGRLELIASRHDGYSLVLVENHIGDTFRAVYTVQFAKAVYVLHCFQKKSPSGIRTSKSDIDLIHDRLKLAQQHYKEHYEK